MRCWAHLILSECYLGFLPMASESTIFSLADLAWSLRLLQLERIFFQHLVTVLWLSAPSLFTQQMFSVASTASSNSESISFQIIQCCTCAALKSLTEWSNSQDVSTPAVVILLITVGTFFLSYDKHTVAKETLHWLHLYRGIGPPPRDRTLIWH